MRAIIIAIAAAALAASAVVAQSATARAPGHPHKITAKHHSSFAAQASTRTGEAGTSGPPGYTRDQSLRLDRDIETSRQAGGGGGGGGGGM